MYKYYEYGTKKYYEQELAKAIDNLRMAAAGFSALIKDDTPIGRIDDYANTLREAATQYECALNNYNDHVIGKGEESDENSTQV